MGEETRHLLLCDRKRSRETEEREAETCPPKTMKNPYTNRPHPLQAYPTCTLHRRVEGHTESENVNRLLWRGKPPVQLSVYWTPRLTEKKRET